MKISKREKILLGILIVSLILYGYFKYVYAKQSIKVNNLKEQRFALQTKLDSVNSEITNIKKKESDVKVLNSKIQDKSKLLYPTIAQEKIIIELDSLMSNSKVTGTIGFNDIAVQPVDVKKSEEKKITPSTLQPLADSYNSIFGNQQKPAANGAANNTQAVNNANKPQSNVEQMKVNLSFRGSYSNVVGFIKNIENNAKKITISNMNLSQSSKDEVNGSCVLEFFAVPKVSNEDEDYMKWNYNNSYGKVNPFDGGSSVSVSSTIEQSSAPKKDVYDFAMSVRSINSDLPAVMLGRASDNSKDSYIYADNNSKEPVEISLTQKDNKYYFKYKLSRGSYPMQYSGNGIEFKPANASISLKIFSNKRINEDDKSAADIKIINNTDKTVVVNVDNDDAVNPRVSITGEGHAVDVKRN